MIRFIQERIWSHLPQKVSFKSRLGAAALWGLALPLMIAGIRYLSHRDEPFLSPLIIKIGVVGIALAAALLIPTLGDHVYLNVLRFFSIIGFILGNIALTIFFFMIVTPVAILFKLVRRDELDLNFRTGKAPRWHDYKHPSDPARYYRQF